jgi:hypothetical protein
MVAFSDTESWGCIVHQDGRIEEGSQNGVDKSEKRCLLICCCFGKGGGRGIFGKWNGGVGA